MTETQRLEDGAGEIRIRHRGRLVTVHGLALGATATCGRCDRSVELVVPDQVPGPATEQIVH